MQKPLSENTVTAGFRAGDEEMPHSLEKHLPKESSVGMSFNF